MKKNKILIMVIVLLLAINFLTYMKVGRLEDDLNQVKNSLFGIDRSIGEISNNVSRELYEFKMENAWTRNARAETVSYKEESETAEVKVEVEFNELGKDERIYIVVQDSQGSIVKQMDVTSELKDSLNLVSDFDLAMGQDYTLSIVAESNVAKRSEDLGTIRLSNIMKEVLYVDGHSWEIQFDENGDYKSASMDIMIHTFMAKQPFIEDYFKNREIVSMVGEIYADDRLIDTLDFTDKEVWQISGDAYQSDSEGTKNQLPELKLGRVDDSFMNIHGTYTFDQAVPTDQQVEVHVVLTDNQGESYRYVLPYIFG